MKKIKSILKLLYELSAIKLVVDFLKGNESSIVSEKGREILYKQSTTYTWCEKTQTFKEETNEKI
jgi:hypothetical protein